MTLFKGLEFKKEITRISRNKKLSVKDILEGQDGQVIYLVKYKNKTGYVKVGDPENLTLSNR